jgi:hypothetical protein
MSARNFEKERRRVMPKVTQGVFLNACDTLLVAAEANADEPGVNDLRLQLESDSGGAREAQSRRARHRSLAQEASRDLDRYLAAAREGYSRLRHLLIGRYGLRSEKLAEFGLQPLRPAQRPKETPPEIGRTPTQAAAPETQES